MRTTAVSRRSALAGAATVGLGLPLLAACGDGTADESSASEPAAASPTTDGAPTAHGAPADGIVATADVPIGGGVVIGAREVVITQPTKGEFKAFSAICTHAGCTVGTVTDTINCPCHGSTFSIEDGSPTGGPAPSPLPQVAISVAGGEISLA